ncbi:MAG: iron ABC transporter permease [Euryarchaeota archaeon]|nr:iron ABC transporter permease [Euryarchaeota archaeon]
MRIRHAALLAFPPLVFLATFFLYPLSAIVAQSLHSPAQALDAISTAASDPFNRRAILFTFEQAVLSVLLSIAVGLPSAWLLYRQNVAGRTWIRALITLPFVLPPLVVAMALLSVLSQNSGPNAFLTATLGLSSPLLTIPNGLALIVLSHAYYNAAVVTRVVGAAWESLGDTYMDQARTLGATRASAFLRVTLPLLMPSIASSSLLVFFFSFTAFGTVLLLGAPGDYTIEVAVYLLTAQYFRLDSAAGLALLQVFFTGLVLFAYARFGGSRRMFVETGRGSTRKAAGWATRVAAYALAFLFALPLLGLVVGALSTPTGIGFTNFEALGSDERGSLFYVTPSVAVWNSVTFAIATALVALPLGVLAALSAKNGGRVSKALLGLYALPLITPAITLAFGYILVFGRPPLALRTTMASIVIAHSLIAFPFVFAGMRTAVASITPSLNEAARTLGASRVEAFRRVELPLLVPSLVAVAVFAAAISLGEFAAALLLVRPEWTTVPVAIFRYVALPGSANLGQARALATILLLVSMAAFIALEAALYRRGGRRA